MVILEVNRSRHLSYRTGYLASTRLNRTIRERLDSSGHLWSAQISPILSKTAKSSFKLKSSWLSQLDFAWRLL